MSRKQLRLSLAGFRKWLRGKNPEDTVGLRSKVASCPIACYLKSQNVEGCHSIEVLRAFYDCRTPGRQAKSTKLKKWAEDFVATVDRDWSDNEERNKVSAAEALRVLDEVVSQAKEEM